MSTNLSASDHDGAWKTALLGYFPQCLSLLWPDMHARIDWRQPPEFLDKELHKLARGAATGERRVDILVRLQGLDGQPVRILVHVEIQARPTPAFAQRMYVYHARLRDRCADAEITSLAIVLRGLPSLSTSVGPRLPKPMSLTYHHQGLDCELIFRFPAIHLQAWRDHVATLEARAACNPFALVVLAQLQASSGRTPEAQLARKTQL